MGKRRQRKPKAYDPTDGMDFDELMNYHLHRPKSPPPDPYGGKKPAPWDHDQTRGHRQNDGRRRRQLSSLHLLLKFIGRMQQESSDDNLFSGFARSSGFSRDRPVVFIGHSTNSTTIYFDIVCLANMSLGDDWKLDECFGFQPSFHENTIAMMDTQDLSETASRWGGPSTKNPSISHPSFEVMPLTI
jgi:hypothetical protein